MYFQTGRHTLTHTHRTIQKTNQLITNSPCLAKGKDNRKAGRVKALLCLFSSKAWLLRPTRVRLEHFIEPFWIAAWPCLWIDPELTVPCSFAAAFWRISVARSKCPIYVCLYLFSVIQDRPFILSLVVVFYMNDIRKNKHLWILRAFKWWLSTNWDQMLRVTRISDHCCAPQHPGKRPTAVTCTICVLSYSLY